MTSNEKDIVFQTELIMIFVVGLCLILSTFVTNNVYIAMEGILLILVGLFLKVNSDNV